MIGRIVRLNNFFGFIESDYPDFEDHFFDGLELIDVPFSDKLRGMRVTFESVQTERGKEAHHVRPIES